MARYNSNSNVQLFAIAKIGILKKEPAIKYSGRLLKFNNPGFVLN